MDSKLSSVIEKVQKLLALSKSSNANEAATAAALANRLIDQYRLAESDIQTEAPADDAIQSDDGYVYETGRVTEWKRVLVGTLAKHYGVAHFNDISMATGRKVSRFKLVGRKSDIAIARYMFGWLELECQRLSEKEARGMGHVYAQSYCAGFVAGVAEQLAASRKEVQQTASSSAIVKLDSRFDLSKSFMYAQFNLKKSRTVSQGQFNSAGFASGQVRGKNVHLGAVMGSGPVKMLGK